MYIRSIIVTMLFPLLCYSQYNSPINYNWAFGINGGIRFVNGNSPITFNTSINSSEAAACVSDENGNLLFYTDGTTIWNRDHNIMPNGDTLTGILQRYGNVISNQVTSSSIQGALIVPVPGNLYYVFSITHGIMSDSIHNAGKLFYSMVDMALNNGYGAVVPGKKGILMDSLLLESMAAVKGIDNNVWVLVHAKDQETFKAFEINCNGVSSRPVESRTGFFVRPAGYSASGIITVAPNQRKIALSNFDDTKGRGNLELYNFDPATGIVSNPVSLSPWATPNPIDTLHFFSAAFSPNSGRLYTMGYSRGGSVYYNLFQHDLTLSTTTDIINSRTLIDSCNGGLMRLGPDGKIYMVKGSRICRINKPDALGLLADFETGVIDSFFAYGLTFGNDAISISEYAPSDTIFRSFCIQPCFGDTTIQYSSGYQYLWNTGAITNTLNISEAGTYWVMITGGCNIRVDTYHVYINNLPEITTTKECYITDSAYAIARFPSGDTGTYTLTWLDRESNILKTSVTSAADSLLQPPGNYRLHVKVYAPCDTTIACERTIPFTIEPPLPYNASFTIDSILCQHQTYTFQNTSTGNLNTWYWDFGDGLTSVQQNPQHSYSFPGSYKVALIAANNTPCYDTFYKDITVDSFGSVSFSTGKTEICTGENIFFYPYHTGNLTALYWDFGNDNYPEGAKNERRHAFDKEGIYPVTLTGKFRACPDTTFTDTIKVFPIPIVNLGNDAFICEKGIPVVLKNTVNNPGTYYYLWNTGTTTGSIEARHPGIYTLTVTNEKGCSNTGTIEVKKDCYTDIPNAFTPNGDGANDYFFPRQFLSKGVSHFHMQVFNRWGEKVFETVSTAGRGWDGKFNGREQPAGVYVYVIEIGYENGQHEKYEGNILLLR